MNLDELKQSGCIIFECIGGSRAYGLATQASDVDIRGVFILPQEQLYSFSYEDQISDERSNIVYYELRKFLELLSKNNPNSLELLNIPEDCILYKHPLYDKIKAKDFVSLLCKDSFAGYATSQLKKAYGLNKKVVNPVDKEKKSILDFCYVLQDQQHSMPLMKFLDSRGLSAQKCGLVSIAHMKEVYSVFYSEAALYKGIVNTSASMDVLLSSVPKGESPIATLFFNKDGYSRYCKDYKDYWHWVENRNADRYQNTIDHGKNYDAKNMMHVFRLLAMAEQIGLSGKIVVRQSDREFLLKIKRGEFFYEELVDMAQQKLQDIEAIYRISSLLKEPDFNFVNQLLIDIRKEFYANHR
ncbi:MAG: nucleotidyltransferase domain-containing protein [Chlamydiales bacterium]|nr:nucleotidyltransferase domain-containing protein [Chlamydiales bacterium]